MMTKHAYLGASSAHRWLVCTASPSLELEFPDTGSEFAAEGTLAHELAELKVRKFCVEAMPKATYTRRFNKIKKAELWQPEMDEHTETYLDYIKQVMYSYKSAPYVVVERTVHFDEYVPEGFGTADCLILAGDTLHVIDFKYGKGIPVSAEENPQMMLYALGALKEYAMLINPKQVKLTIVQPRLHSISEWEVYVDDLTYWGETEVKPLAKIAFEGKNGTFEPGVHCRFCRAKHQCKARSEYYAALHKVAKDNPNPALITPAELGEYLSKATELKKWTEDLQEFALHACLEGKDVPGWKAVEGRGSRQFKDFDTAFKILIDNGIDEALLYERVPLTLAKAEKVVTKNVFNELLADEIIKSAGRPTLAPESDKRKAVTSVVKAEDVFTKLEEK